MRAVVLKGSATLAGVFLLFATTLAQASESMNRCHDVAAQCRQQGGGDVQCRQRVDACMNDRMCEEVYLSCLELMEADESVTEAACEQKKVQCRSRYGQ